MNPMEKKGVLEKLQEIFRDVFADDADGMPQHELWCYHLPYGDRSDTIYDTFRRAFQKQR